MFDASTRVRSDRSCSAAAWKSNERVNPSITVGPQEISASADYWNQGQARSGDKPGGRMASRRIVHVSECAQSRSMTPRIPFFARLLLLAVTACAASPLVAQAQAQTSDPVRVFIQQEAERALGSRGTGPSRIDIEVGQPITGSP